MGEPSNKRFVDWLLGELEKRDLSQAELARRAGISRGGLSNLITGDRRPGRKVSSGIARALNIPAEEVWRIAGLLPPSADKTPRAERAAYLFDNLTPQEQLTMLDVMEGMVSNRSRRSKHGSKEVVDETREQQAGRGT